MVIEVGNLKIKHDNGHRYEDQIMFKTKDIRGIRDGYRS